MSETRYQLRQRTFYIMQLDVESYKDRSSTKLPPPAVKLLKLLRVHDVIKINHPEYPLKKFFCFLTYVPYIFHPDTLYNCTDNQLSSRK